MNFRIPWSGRAYDYSEEEIQAVVDVMRHGDPLTQGPHLTRFEADFRAWLGVDHAFAVTNCTNAIDLTAILAHIKPGDEVVAPAHTFCASVIPFLRRGATLRFADIDPGTRLISAQTIERVVSARTKLIVVVHLNGLMPDMDPILGLARSRNIAVMEDCAQAIGAEDRGRKAGTLGDFAVFSFHGQKSITTLGEGGVLVVKDPALGKKVPGLRHNGVRPYARAPDERRYWVPAMSEVDLDIDNEVPFNFCLGEAQCALASATLKRVDRMNDDRARRATRFKEALREFPELSFQHVANDKKHVYHLLPARYDPPRPHASRDALIERLAYEHQIKAIVQYYPLYRYPLFQRLGMGNSDCPETDRYFDRMVSFPFHHWMSDDDFAYMIDRTRETLSALRKA